MTSGCSSCAATASSAAASTGSAIAAASPGVAVSLLFVSYIIGNFHLLVTLAAAAIGRLLHCCSPFHTSIRQ